LDWYVLWDFNSKPPLHLWTAAVPVLLVAVGIVVRTLMRAVYEDAFRFIGDIFMLGAFALAVAFGFASVHIVREYFQYRSLYQLEEFEVVEGEISRHQFAMDGKNPSNTTGRYVPESFTVGDVSFSFHPRVIECHCFRNAGWEISLNDGDYVRIAHIDGNILRLERRR